MTSILGISGSLRKNSFNTSLLIAAQDMLPANTALKLKTLHGIPLYDQDEEANNGAPKEVIDLQKAIIEADGIIIATPEYNSSMPGVLKNAIDWASRPSKHYQKVFAGKPVALIGASLGRTGTALAQDAWLTVLRGVSARPWFGGWVTVPFAGRCYDENGTLTDPVTKDELRKFLSDFIADIQ